MKDLNLELVELFDLKKAKLRHDKDLTAKSQEAQKDFRHLTIMFRDNIPSLKVKIDEDEYIHWDDKSGELLFVSSKMKVILEAAPKEICIKARPFLFELVQQAKKFYL